MHHEFMKRGLQLLCVCLLAGAGHARAVEPVAAPSNGFELSLGLGYGQGLGPVASRVPRLQELGGAGGTTVLNAGWRIDPRWEVGVYGEFGLFSSGDLPGDKAYSAGAGVQGQFHLFPGDRYDPWAGVGFGWRGYWSDLNGGTYGLQGLDLARLQLGVDYRVTQAFAVGPVVALNGLLKP